MELTFLLVLWDHYSVCVCPSQCLKQPNEIHDIWFEGNAVGGHPNQLHFNFLQPVITTWRTQELVRWERH
jgi:hypothetical protein